MSEPLNTEEHDDGKIERLRRAIYSREMADKFQEVPRRPLDPDISIAGRDWKRAEDTQEVSGSVFAPRSIMIIRSVMRAMLALAILFFVGSILFFGYYFLIGAGSVPASPENISITVSGPTRISGGEPTQLQIVVVNHNAVALELADLVITYPRGTRSPSDYATDLSTQRISLGTIEPGGQRQGTVSAVFAGDVNTAPDVGVDLEYHLHGSSAIFVAHSDYGATMSSSPLSISVQGNQEAISGQPLQFTVTIASNASAPVKDTLLSIEYPFGFAFSSASPSPKSAGFWELGDLAPGQQRTVVVRGTLTGASGDQRSFRFTAGTRTKPTDKVISTALSSQLFTANISQPFLGLSLGLNDAQGKDVTLAPGDPVKVTVQWQNNLQTTVTDAVIVARLSGLQIDGTNIQTTDGFFRSTDNTVLWDKTTTNGALASLPPGSHGAVSFSFKVPAAAVLQNIRNPLIAISVSAAGTRTSEAGVPQSLQSATSQRISIASDLQLTAQGYYYQNPFGVSGPMPPKAGDETSYGIVFTLTNTTNSVQGGKLTAHLPPYVRWMGVYGPGSEDVTFDQNQGVVTWNVGNVDPGVGLNSTPPRQMAVKIGLTPSTSQIGQEPVIVQNISFTGTDATGVSISKSAKDITTNIVGDPGFVPTNATVVR